MASERPWEQIKQIKRCGIYLLPEGIYVVGTARTVPGFCIESEPIFKLERKTSTVQLGEAVIAALKAFRIDVASPDPGSRNTSPLLARTHMRSWKQLERTALLVEISFDGDAVQVMPTSRDLDRGGYQPGLISLANADLTRKTSVQLHSAFWNGVLKLFNEPERRASCLSRGGPIAHLAATRTQWKG
jgi:hypothetical protein